MQASDKDQSVTVLVFYVLLLYGKTQFQVQFGLALSLRKKDMKLTCESTFSVTESENV